MPQSVNQTWTRVFWVLLPTLRGVGATAIICVTATLVFCFVWVHLHVQEFVPSSGKCSAADYYFEPRSLAVDRLFAVKPVDERIYVGAFSADGAWIASGGDFSTVNLLSLEGRSAWSIGTGCDFVSAVTFSSDGKRLGCFCQNRTKAAKAGLVKVWDIPNRREMCTFVDRSEINTIALSIDNKQVVTGDSYGVIKVWDIGSGRVLKTLRGHTDAINGLSFNSTGKMLASASSDKTVRTWDYESGKEMRRFIGHEYFACSVTFSPDGKLVATADALTLRRNGMAKRCMWVLSRETGEVVSEGGNIKIWKVDSGEELRSVPVGAEEVSAIVFSPDGKIVAGRADNKIVLCEFLERGSIVKVGSGTSLVLAVAFSRSGHAITGIDADGKVKIWSVNRERMGDGLHFPKKPMIAPQGGRKGDPAGFP